MDGLEAYMDSDARHARIPSPFGTGENSTEAFTARDLEQILGAGRCDAWLKCKELEKGSISGHMVEEECRFSRTGTLCMAPLNLQIL